MDFSEKVLYHQIHPAKLAADLSGSIVSTYLMWRRRFAWAMLAAFVPAVLASVSVIRYADLEQRKHSRFGRYMQRYMDRRVLDAWRFFGQVLRDTGRLSSIDTTSDTTQGAIRRNSRQPPAKKLA